MQKHALLPLFAATSLLMTVTAANAGDIDIKSRGTALVSACMNDAIARGDVSRSNGTRGNFVCRGEIAEATYNALRRFSEPERSAQRNGTFLVLEFYPQSPNECWHRIEDPQARATSDFGCRIGVEMGDLGSF